MILVTCCCECWMIVVVRARHVLVMLLRIDFYSWTQKQGGNKSNAAVNYLVLSLWQYMTPHKLQEHSRRLASWNNQLYRKWKIRHVPRQTNKVKWIQHTQDADLKKTLRFERLWGISSKNLRYGIFLGLIRTKQTGHTPSNPGRNFRWYLPVNLNWWSSDPTKN